MLWLILAYPLLTHAAVWLNEPRLQWAALTVLAATSMFDALQKRRTWAWITLGIVCAILFALVQYGGGMFVLYIAPILLPGSLLVLFLRSMRGDSTPMITRYALAIRGSLSDELAAHTRTVTQVWCLLLAALAISATACALFASRQIWSLMTNFVHYIALGTMFVCEYAYRRYKFPDLEHVGFVAYIRALLGVRVRPT